MRCRSKVQTASYTLANVLEDAKKMQDKGVVKPGYGFYPRPSNGPDYWQFYTSFGGVMEEDGKLVFDKAAMTTLLPVLRRCRRCRRHQEEPYRHARTTSGSPKSRAGKAGIWHGGTWHYARYVNQEGLTDFFGNVAFSLIPAGEGGKANTLTHPLVYLLTTES